MTINYDLKIDDSHQPPIRTCYADQQRIHQQTHALPFVHVQLNVRGAAKGGEARDVDA